MMPMSAINGTLMVRSGQISVDLFNAEITEQFPYPRAIFVPIDLPPTYERAVKSAARRALGPQSDLMEKSGVSFSMRCIGVRARDDPAPDAVPAVPAVEVSGDEIDDQAQDVATSQEDQDMAFRPAHAYRVPCPYHVFVSITLCTRRTACRWRP